MKTCVMGHSVLSKYDSFYKYRSRFSLFMRFPPLLNVWKQQTGEEKKKWKKLRVSLAQH
jgi:hypothetical protein